MSFLNVKVNIEVPRATIMAHCVGTDDEITGLGLSIFTFYKKFFYASFADQGLQWIQVHLYIILKTIYSLFSLQSKWNIKSNIKILVIFTYK